LIENQLDHMVANRQGFEMLEQGAAELAEQLGEEVDERRVKAWRKHKEVTVPEYLVALAEMLRKEAADEVVQRWKELRALETVWEAFRAEFDGEDPVVP